LLTKSNTPGGGMAHKLCAHTFLSNVDPSVCIQRHYRFLPLEVRVHLSWLWRNAT